MRLLHLSDLHVTWSDESLDTLWGSVRRAADDAPFDAIILSGDLTQSAAVTDYTELLAFIDTRLLSAVADGDRTRIVAIPGNHDVAWGAKIGEHRSVFELGPDRAASAFKAALQGGESSYRVMHSGFGHFELLEITNPHEKFRNVQQEFFDKLYPDPSGSHLARSMNLLDEGEDWSAHVFSHDKIAIFGFNSCHGNDRFWHGARINPASIVNAEEFARSRLKGWLCCAVWHHGISSVGHRVDHLSLSDISRLANAGFRVGFHGHTHEAATQVFRGRFTHDITLVATGSLGAGTDDRPDAVGNQFSVIFLSETEMHGTIFERRPPHDFEVRERFQERVRDLIPTPKLELSITTHRRHYFTDAEGFTEATVELGKAPSPSIQDGMVTIAQLRPPVCSTQCTSPEVTESKSSSGETRYSVSLKSVRPEGTTFTYRASNMFALSQLDLRCRNDRPITAARNLQLWEERLHQVRFPCQELVLDYRFATDMLADGAEPTVVWVDEMGASYTLEEEIARCQVERPSNAHIRLAVSTPQVGVRYGLRYMPPQDSASPGYRESEGFCRRLIKIGRHRTVDHGYKGISVIKNINTTMIPAIKEHLELESDSFSWMLLVWNPSIRHLVPAFGEFEAAKWGLRFEHGSGVAGHALRFRRIARWHRDRAQDSLVYLQVPLGQEIADRHVWLLCVPILLFRGGQSIGVLTLESNENEDPGLERLESFARSERDNADTSHLLLYASNITFWTSCQDACKEASGQTFSASDRELVEQAVQAWTNDTGYSL